MLDIFIFFNTPPQIPCVSETPKQVLLQTVKTQMKCSIISGSSLLVKVKKIFRQKNTICRENYNLTPLDTYNGLSQLYCIKPEGRIHQYTKG